MKCPICSVNLIMSDRQGVEIDYCPECRGVWLDRGELDKIIEKSDNNGPNEQRNKEDEEDEDNYSNRSNKDNNGRKKGGGGFLSNLMDFGGD